MGESNHQPSIVTTSSSEELTISTETPTTKIEFHQTPPSIYLEYNNYCYLYQINHEKLGKNSYLFRVKSLTKYNKVVCCLSTLAHRGLYWNGSSILCAYCDQTEISEQSFSHNVDCPSRNFVDIPFDQISFRKLSIEICGIFDSRLCVSLAESGMMGVLNEKNIHLFCFHCGFSLDNEEIEQLSNEDKRKLPFTKHSKEFTYSIKHAQHSKICEYAFSMLREHIKRIIGYTVSYMNNSTVLLLARNIMSSSEENIVSANDSVAPKCLICLDRSINIMFQPCNHASVCEICNVKIEKCIVCREIINRSIKFYLVT